MTRLLVVQHLPHEHEGVLGEVLVTRDLDVVRCRAWAEPVPTTLEGMDALVVLGGDMNTDEEADWPHLREVRDLLRVALDEAVPTLGLCLGAQLLAEAGGGTVHHGTPEIGWIPIEQTGAGRADPVVSAVPDGTPFFNAHADYVSLPPGATLLSRSADTDVHAFRLSAALGLQHHPEIDASFVAGYVEAPGVARYLGANGWTPEELVSEARRRNAAHRAAGQALFEAWVDSIG